ncbi:hypothetical protein SEVIR_8G184750v4 [Setaria viridis]|uniref:Uncharacterized protein n=1 Tax=Setaria viridis TaxID=4556 RepID=A0A4U6TGM9_SETVI|nr:hypothetical protein SEVIR_8G184750v2 [Setaria viridis]
MVLRRVWKCVTMWKSMHQGSLEESTGQWCSYLEEVLRTPFGGRLFVKRFNMGPPVFCVFLGPVLMNYKLAKHAARKEKHMLQNCSGNMELCSTLEVGTYQCLSILIAKSTSGSLDKNDKWNNVYA